MNNISLQNDYKLLWFTDDLWESTYLKVGFARNFIRDCDVINMRVPQVLLLSVATDTSSAYV